MNEITLKAARVNAGYKTDEISEKLGVSKSCYRKWEQGLTKMPASKYMLFCKLVNRTPDSIILDK